MNRALLLCSPRQCVVVQRDIEREREKREMLPCERVPLLSLLFFDITASSSLQPFFSHLFFLFFFLPSKGLATPRCVPASSEVGSAILTCAEIAVHATFLAGEGRGGGSENRVKNWRVGGQVVRLLVGWAMFRVVGYHIDIQAIFHLHVDDSDSSFLFTLHTFLHHHRHHPFLASFSSSSSFSFRHPPPSSAASTTFGQNCRNDSLSMSGRRHRLLIARSGLPDAGWGLFVKDAVPKVCVEWLFLSSSFCTFKIYLQRPL